MFPKRVAILSDVRERTEGNPVELWILEDGRPVIRCYNECMNNCTDLDLIDFLDWSRSHIGMICNDRSRLPALSASQ